MNLLDKLAVQVVAASDMQEGRCELISRQGSISSAIEATLVSVAFSYLTEIRWALIDLF